MRDVLLDRLTPGLRDFWIFLEITNERERITFTEFDLCTKGGSRRDPSVTLFDPDFMSNLDDNFQDFLLQNFTIL